MLEAKTFYDTLQENNITFFTGVPDSLLKFFCAYVTDNAPAEKNIIAANEGAAIALAAGHYLASGTPGVVYMQNSGQGNTVNPLTSLADPDVYSIPMLLVIGWRGEPGKKDEPQHVKQGAITLGMLNVLGIPYKILPDDAEGAIACVRTAAKSMQETHAPYALVIRKGTFDKYVLQNKTENAFQLSREEAIKSVINLLDPKDIIVSTTGKASREVFEYREEQGGDHSKDFLTVGCMGHSSQIALGIALQKPDRNVFCLDGDGAAIMHLGSLAINAQHGPANFKHIMLNNGAHDSVGGQPTVAHAVDFQTIASGCGYAYVARATTTEEIAMRMHELRAATGPGFLEILVNKGARSDLGRPTTTPQQNKVAFMQFLQ